MKLSIAHEIPAATFAAIEALCAASNLRDIQLQGNPITLSRDDYTQISDDEGPEAGSVLNAVQHLIRDDSDAPNSRIGVTIFGVGYEHE